MVKSQYFEPAPPGGWRRKSHPQRSVTIDSTGPGHVLVVACDDLRDCFEIALDYARLAARELAGRLANPRCKTNELLLHFLADAPTVLAEGNIWEVRDRAFLASALSQAIATEAIEGEGWPPEVEKAGYQLAQLAVALWRQAAEGSLSPGDQVQKQYALLHALRAALSDWGRRVAKEQREEDVLKILFPDGSARLAADLQDPAWRETLQRLVEVWFLRRYDLVNTFHLLRQLPRPKKGRARERIEASAPGERAKLKRPGKTHSSWMGVLASGGWVAFLMLLFGLAWGYPHQAPRLLGLVVGISILIGLLFCTYFRAGALFLPRLLGGLVVGYLVVLPTADLWQWALQPEAWRPITLIATLSVVGSLFYLHFGEVSKAVGRPGPAWARSLTVWFIGIGLALVIGLVASWCVTPYLQQAKAQEWGKVLQSAVHVPLWFCSTLYPLVLILQASAALFVGLFAQILWEEKEITHPL